ncbi:DUF2510 domain-containing protein [Nocardioides albidus]|uniref:DUF2510 domain-containing protein n=1 Tax=Nocardioides albidus TaxID=1517589 RepID=A0A5C4VPQ9_9ACTN|nr:DUF2510 domain-containing protein [Nocardioides albidus]TNM37797.1 DUF2510 domain-containing protein [Nocardioides albidus]
MSEQAPEGWYPDGHGNERFWDGAAWTEQVRALSVGDAADKKPGAFSKLGSAVKAKAAEKKASKEEAARRHAENAQAAGSLVTSGVFGTSTVEIYEGGFVRVASWPERVNGNGPCPIDKKTPYERLRSIKYTGPSDESSGGPSALEGAVGPAVAKLLKGGKGLMKASAPGMAAAGIGHLASNAARKSFLTIATDQRIHTLDNQSTNSVGLKTSNKGHNEVGIALQEAGNAILGISSSEPGPVADVPHHVPAAQAPPAESAAAPTAAAPTIGDRLRELAALHKDGILSDDEFAAAKATLLGGL